MSKIIDWRGEEVADPVLVYAPRVKGIPHFHIECGNSDRFSHRLKLTPQQAHRLWQQLDAYFTTPVDVCNG
jgi:hypothetical protein